MKTFEFSIVASGLNPQDDDFESRFYDAGCDDATISFQKGHIIVDFSREAESIEAAIASAVQNVLSAGAAVDRIEPDPLVNLSDIAERTGLTRAAISLYAKELRSRNFPSPIVRVTSESPLWDWPSVAAWFFEHKKLDRETVIEAALLKVANDEIRAGALHLESRLSSQRVQLEAAM